MEKRLIAFDRKIKHIKHIISIGGNDFGRSIGDLKIEKYILSQSNKDKPNMLHSNCNWG